MSPSSKTNNVGAWSSARRVMETDRLVTRALRAGTTGMRSMRSIFLPPDMRERNDPIEYEGRLQRTYLLPRYDEAVSDLAARPFQRDIQCKGVETLPPELQKLPGDCDRAGTPLSSLGRAALDDMWDHGIGLILVDKPNVTVPMRDGAGKDVLDDAGKPMARVMTLAEEQADDVRPYFVRIDPDAVISWAWRDGNGKRVLSMLSIYEESTAVDTATLTETTTQRVRVWREASWEVWERPLPEKAMQRPSSTTGASLESEARLRSILTAQSEDGSDAYRLVASGANPLGEIPVVWSTIQDDAADPLFVKPPLIDLAWKNVEHWQHTSDVKNVLRYALCPVLLFTGVDDVDMQIVVGAGAVIKSRNPDLDAKYLEIAGGGVAAGEKQTDRIEQDMAKLAQEPLIAATGAGAQTATGEGVNEQRTQTRAQAAAEKLEWLLYRAFEMAAKWIGQPLPEEFDIAVFRDFGLVARTANDLQALDAMRTRKDVSQETYLRECVARKVLVTLTNEDIEDEIARTDDEGAALADMLPAPMPPGQPPGAGATPPPVDPPDASDPDADGA